MIDSMLRDLRYALRGLPRRPAFTFATVLTLALGIGATTAIFSVVYSVLIKPLPYPNSGELMRIRHSAVGLGVNDIFASTNMYLTYRDENRTFASIGLWQEDSATLTDRGKADRVRALRVTDGTLQALGIQPMLGRWFTEQEHGAAAEGPAPVILSYAFWQRRFGGDEAALGRALSLDSSGGGGTLRLPPSSQVVGILPPDFRFLDAALQPDIVIPMRLDPARQAHGIYSYQMLARLKPGVSLAEAQADLDRIRPIWFDAWPPFPGTTKEQFVNMQITPVAHPLLDDLVGGVASMLWVLMGAIGAVLMIACANIANLMLVRADARRPEFAVRAALGALPARIARELLSESLVLGAAGSALGLVFAYVGLRGLVAIGPSDLPRLQEITLHPPVLVFTVVISLASTLVFGSITALKHALHIETPATGATRGSSANRERSATRNMLVVVQVALALVLVVSAVLMIRTFQALRDVDPGFSNPATIQTARIWIPPGRDEQQTTLIEHEILDKIAALPGVVAVGFSSNVPMDTQQSNGPVTIEGDTLVAGAMPPQRRWIYVSPGYFAAMGTRMIAGRDVTWTDIETGGRVAVISEDFARELAVDPAGALGRRIKIGPFPQDDWKEVIGVVQNVHQDGLYQATPSSVYWPVLSRNMFARPAAAWPWPVFAIRTERAGAATLMNEIRDAIRSLSATIPIGEERTMQDYYAGSLARTSFTLVMLAIAGGMALFLGVIGIYGVIAYVVSRRAREIGIRSALGAEPRQLEKMFLLHGLTLSGVGVVVGLVVAAALGRSMSSLLFGIEPMDPAAYMAAIGIILAAAALASYLPARRAARIDPMQALREE
ncbi:MAG: ABC transporter permease [Gammaproteobacteria bacterium]|nr:MAG: ABC transporter permease [Gammaproteobacteria bacterium]